MSEAQWQGTTDLVWLTTGFLGDIILATAAMELAKSALPGVRQHAITTPLGAQVLAGYPELTSRIVFAKGKEPTWRSLTNVRRSLQASLAPFMDERFKPALLQPHRSTRSTLLARVLNLPTVTYQQTALAFLADARVERVAVLHEAQRIALLLAPFGVERRAMLAARPFLAPLPLAADGWQGTLQAWPGRVIAVAPGSVWGTKRWLPAAFAQLTKRLLSLPETLVVFLGSPDEAALAASIATEVGATGRLMNLAGQTSFADLRRLYPRLSLLVANDSSPVHMASAFKIPTLAVFGATVPAMGFAPLAPRSVALGIALPCRPCSDHGPQVCPLGHFKCMRELSVDQVWGACEELLAEEKPRP